MFHFTELSHKNTYVHSHTGSCHTCSNLHDNPGRNNYIAYAMGQGPATILLRVVQHPLRSTLEKPRLAFVNILSLQTHIFHLWLDESLRLKSLST